MATIQNKVNQLLYSAPDRITGATVKLSPGVNSVLVVPKNSSTPVPAVTTVTAITNGYTQPTYKWFVRFNLVDNISAEPEFIEQVGQTSNPFVLNTGAEFYTSFGLINTAVEIKVEVSESAGVGTYGVNSSSDILSIPVLREGNDGSSFNSLTLTLYKRTTTDAAPTVTTTGNTTYNFATSTVVGQPTGWSLSVPSNSFGSYLWSISIRIASQNNSYSFANSTWSAPIQVAVDGIKGTNTALLYAYKRSAVPVTDTPGDISYSFTTNTIENTVLANDWSKTIPDGMDALYVSTATAASKESQVIVLSSQWTAPVVLATSGITVATVYLYLRNNNSGSPPAVTQSGSCTYNFANGVLSGSIPSGWTQLLPAISSGSVLWVMQATASNSSSSDTINNTEWSVPRILTTGSSRGIRQLYSNNIAYTSINGYQYSTAAAGAASYALKATELLATATTTEGLLPTTPLTGDMVTFTNGTNFIYTIAYNASISAWEPPGTIIDGSLLVTNSITAAKINTNGLTIRDTLGNVILSAGVPLSTSYIDSTFVDNVTTAKANAATAITNAAAAATAASNAATAASNAATTANNAATAAADKLSKSAASTLAATLSVSSVAGAGFKTGTLNWGADGAWISGKGVAMTSAGLMCHNGVRATFNLNASTGDATFGGVAQSADGKFVIDFVNKTISITV